MRYYLYKIPRRQLPTGDLLTGQLLSFDADIAEAGIDIDDFAGGC